MIRERALHKLPSLIFLASCLSVAGCEPKNKVLASMNGATVTEADLQAGLAAYKDIGNKSMTDKEREQKTLETLVSQKVLLLSAKEAGYNVDTGKYIFSLDEASKKSLGEYDKILVQKFSPTDNDLKAYYKSHLGEIKTWPQFKGHAKPPMFEECAQSIKNLLIAQKFRDWYQQQRSHFQVVLH